jgi:hypothetical protein
MEQNKALIFAFRVIAVILGVTLFKQFDFVNLKFEKTRIAIVYMIGFATSVYVLIKNKKDQVEK